MAPHVVMLGAMKLWRTLAEELTDGTGILMLLVSIYPSVAHAGLTAEHLAEVAPSCILG